MLNKRGPRIEPCGTPDIMFSHVILNLEGNLESLSKQEMTIHKDVVLRLVSHDKYNQKLSIGQ